MSRFFRGVCPILNRITAAIFGLLSHRHALRFQIDPVNRICLTAFLMQGEETPGRVERKFGQSGSKRPSHRSAEARSLKTATGEDKAVELPAAAEQI